MTDLFAEEPPEELPPLDLAPMRPQDGPPPDTRGHRWVYQIEVPGERVVVHVRGALSDIGLLPELRIVNSDGQELNTIFPELKEFLKLPSLGPFTIDGVITPTGSITDLPFRLAATDAEDAAIRAEAKKVELVIRDLVYLDGKRVGDLPYAARRFLLTSRIPRGDVWRIPEDHLDPADALTDDETIDFPTPYLLSRRLDGRYFSGVSRGTWIRSSYRVIKRVPVVGWLDDRPGEHHHTDALLIAGKMRPEGYRPVQAVRAGLTIATRTKLAALLEQLPVTGSPPGLRYRPSEEPGPTVQRWARPTAVATVVGTAMTDDALLESPVILDVEPTQ